MCIEQDDCYGKDEEPYSSVQHCHCLSIFKHPQPQKAVLYGLDMELKHNESSDVLFKYIANVATQDSTSFSMMTQNCDAEQRTVGTEKSLNSTDCQVRAADAIKTQSDYNVALPDENYSTESHETRHTSEPSDKDFSYRMENSEPVREQKKIKRGVKPFKCDICDARYTYCSQLNIHKRIHTGQKPFKCDVCGGRFTDKSNLNVHKRIHTGEKPYKCDFCGTGFTQYGSLKSHEKTHTGEKPFKCDICGMCFIKSNNLRRHVRIHTGEKPYKCELCGITFSESSKLTIHKRVHTAEKPYKCHVCGAGFTQCSNLKTHERTHTGEKPYKCDFCGTGYTRRSHLKSHEKSHAETHNGEKA